MGSAATHSATLFGTRNSNYRVKYMLIQIGQGKGVS